LSSILILDEDGDARAALKQILVAAGYEVVGTGTRESGPRLYRKVTPDLVIAAIFVPEHKGMKTVFRILHEDPAARILAIGHGLEGRPGIADHLSGAFNLAQLLDKVDRCLDPQETPKRLAGGSALHLAPERAALAAE
jgi:DNA-binding NtrC family response regulator